MAEESWTELVEKGIAAREQHDAAQWELGRLADAVETHYGDHDLQRYAIEIGVGYRSLLRYRDVHRAYAEGSATRVADLSWSHHRAVAKLEDREEWLRKAKAEEWSVARLITEAIGPPRLDANSHVTRAFNNLLHVLPPPIGADLDDDERAALEHIEAWARLVRNWPVPAEELPDAEQLDRLAGFLEAATSAPDEWAVLVLGILHGLMIVRVAGGYDEDEHRRVGDVLSLATMPPTAPESTAGPSARAASRATRSSTRGRSNRPARTSGRSGSTHPTSVEEHVCATYNLRVTIHSITQVTQRGRAWMRTEAVTRGLEALHEELTAWIGDDAPTVEQLDAMTWALGQSPEAHECLDLLASLAELETQRALMDMGWPVEGVQS
jgi:hypothetical protein